MSAPGAPVELSVAEIQAALRDLRARRRSAVPHDSAEADLSWPEPVGEEFGVGGWRAGWVWVVAAHAGAGSSTVALAISDALSIAGIRCRLVEMAEPVRSGLLAAAQEELGLDPSGGWRRGRRGLTVICRRAHHRPIQSWPPADDSGVTALDVGRLDPGTVERLATLRPRLVVVCRATVPGVRAATRLIDDLRYPAGAPLVVSAVGSRHWPGPVTASGGRPIARLKAAGRLVAVPIDGRLQITGLTAAPLPRPLLSAGRGIADRIGPDLFGGDNRAAAVPPASGEESR